MKEIIGKVKLLHTSPFPQKFIVSKIDLFGKSKIAHESNKFFAKIGIELTSKIQLKLNLKPT